MIDQISLKTLAEAFRNAAYRLHQIAADLRAKERDLTKPAPGAQRGKVPPPPNWWEKRHAAEERARVCDRLADALTDLEDELPPPTDLEILQAIDAGCHVSRVPERLARAVVSTPRVSRIPDDSGNVDIVLHFALSAEGQTLLDAEENGAPILNDA